MPFFPVLLDVSRGTCLVVGAGRVAARKAAALCEAGARVKIVAPAATPAVERMAAAGKLTLMRRRYRRADLAGCCLVVAATNAPAVNRAVASAAQRLRLPCNSADDPARGSLLFPAIIRRGGLVVAISTEGASPALARRLRRDLESGLGPEYASVVRSLGEARRRTRATKSRRQAASRSERRTAYPSSRRGAQGRVLRAGARGSAEEEP